MKLLPLLIICGLLALHAGAGTFYVNAGNPAAAPPFATWDTAATNIQDAIDAASNGDTVLVTNGIYQGGGTVMAGDLTNRAALNKPVLVQSVNGPWVTIIEGAGATNGTAAVRCAWLTNGASLVGFTLTAGATRNSGDQPSLQSGGGVWCASSNALVGNCVIVSNTAAYNGGGVYQGTVVNSLISSNGTINGNGGVTYESVLNNCTIVSNTTYGAASPLAMTNCIIYFNGPYGSQDVSSSGSAFSHCCTTSTLRGTGNFTSAPQLFADGVHLAAGSPCIGAGVNIVTGTDIFGNAWSNPPAVGCAEWTPSPLVTAPQIKLTADPAGFTVGNLAVGSSSACSFAWFKDGMPLQDNGHFSSTQTTNLIATGVSFGDAGGYQVVVSNSFGVVTSSVAQLVIHCVDVAGINPVAPYLTWETAATNIQDAITTAVAEDVVLVTNGLYAAGGKSIDGLITNRVSVDKAILVQSVNGANLTVIQGAWDPTTTNGLGAVRCVWMTNNAIMDGFTLSGGATRSASSSPNKSMYGGGILGSSTNATIGDSIIAGNTASYDGGGAYSATLLRCTVALNVSLGSGSPNTGIGGSGGGAGGCSLKNCLVTSNSCSQGSGGGVDGCSLRNCALVNNLSPMNGGAAHGGSLINCTVAANTSGSGGAVYASSLTDCIVFGNMTWGVYLSGNATTNYFNSTMVYCCTDPLLSGTGNIDVNPQLLPDNVHLASTSPCIGAGIASTNSRTDIDGQPWNNPPSMGCDEWQPTPVFGAQPSFQVNSPAHGLTCSAVVAGQTPIAYFWSKDGVPVQDDGHYSGSGTANLVVNHFDPDDAGVYQVVVTNAFGVVTSQVAQVVIHAVAANGANPIAPYSTWATAATNIQDAINAAAAGDIVLVTNGLYAFGGKVMAGNLTNRVALNLPVTVMSVNGYAATVIQGAWDPASTNGPAAVRCAYVTDGAVLNGFTLQNGATLATGDASSGGPLESGGGVFCNSQYGIVSDCVLTNNCAIYGGGIRYGSLNNSLVLFNLAAYGGGAYASVLYNCTVVNNYATADGAGTYSGITRNSIVADNYYYPFETVNNYDSATYYNCCTTLGLVYGTGNIYVDPQFLDWFHLATTSPCRGAGSALYASGTDLDGESWGNPPSIGCDEVIVTNLVGPLSVDILPTQTNLLVNRYAGFSGLVAGRAATIGWSFGDGVVVTNSERVVIHQWTNSGAYTVTFTAYNNDNPAGVSTSTIIQVQSLNVPQLQPAALSANGFQFQFIAQTNANYTVQYTTNLVPPVTWQTLQTINNSSGGVIPINDSAWTNTARFYRVLAQ